MKQILINGTSKEERRAAFLVNKTLYDVNIEQKNKAQFKSNIYLAKVSRVEPSLNAAFVNYGAERHGFLPLKEIHSGILGSQDTSNIQIDNVLKEGQNILVQVEKEERGSKGAALTTHIALAGRCLVFLPNNPNSVGVSRRLSHEDRTSMKNILQQLDVPEGSGVIIRTAGLGQDLDVINKDLNYLKKLWSIINKASKVHNSPKLIYQDNGFINRILRDYMQNDIDQIIIDTNDLYQECLTMINQIMPEIEEKITFYEDESIPLFSKYKVEEQIETAYQHEVSLPSGGSITIDHTEALIAIDINSSKSTQGGNIEETALHTNLEACHEIARQLRLRDIGGLIVIDFIDMTPNKNIKEVEDTLKESLRFDRARIQIGKIHRFGLLEMSRQRLSSSLSENTTTTCPKCQGQGVIRTTESLSLSIFRLMQEQICREKTVQVRAKLPIPIATYLLNEKREDFSMLETSFSVSIIILPASDFSIPNYQITWVGEESKTEIFASNEELDTATIETENKLRNKALAKMKPVVQIQETSKKETIWDKIIALFSMKSPDKKVYRKITTNSRNQRKRNDYRKRNNAQNDSKNHRNNRHPARKNRPPKQQ